MLNMTKGINESKTLTKHANVNVNLMEEIVIQVNRGIMIHVDVSVKNVMYVKTNMFGIVKMEII